MENRDKFLYDIDNPILKDMDKDPLFEDGDEDDATDESAMFTLFLLDKYLGCDGDESQ